MYLSTWCNYISRSIPTGDVLYLLKYLMKTSVLWIFSIIQEKGWYPNVNISSIVPGSINNLFLKTAALAMPKRSTIELVELKELLLLFGNDVACVVIAKFFVLGLDAFPNAFSMANLFKSRLAIYVLYVHLNPDLLLHFTCAWLNTASFSVAWFCRDAKVSSKRF